MLELIDPIDLRDEAGGIFGYVVDSDAEQVGHYLDEMLFAHTPAVAGWLASHCGRIAVLKHLEVAEDARGQGLGNGFLRAFMEQARLHGADAVLLIADAHEFQVDGFALQEWYEKHAFAPIGMTGCGPVMLYPEDIAEQLCEALDGPGNPGNPD